MECARGDPGWQIAGLLPGAVPERARGHVIPRDRFGRICERRGPTAASLAITGASGFQLRRSLRYAGLWLYRPSRVIRWAAGSLRNEDLYKKMKRFGIE
jgi:hypothetical protein